MQENKQGHNIVPLCFELSKFSYICKYIHILLYFIYCTRREKNKKNIDTFMTL